MQTHDVSPRFAFPARVRSAQLLIGTLLFLGATLLYGQPATGVITGRVYNPTTSEYVRNAEVRVQGGEQSTVTDNSGYYRLQNVAAGAASISVSYTGYETATAVVPVVGGSEATQNFDLKTTATGSRGEVITLSAFTVSTEREGNAKAIMDQKAAMNVKTVVASDTYGDIAEGNVGEFLKFLPGIALDYVETDTRAARMGGMEARYGSVTMDGNSMANAGSNSRQFEFEAMSINNIESIEINKTLSADMPADAPSGGINLRTKSALDRKGQRFNFTAAFIGNQYDYTFRQTPRHDDSKHAKSRPTYTFDYSNKFFNDKVGIAVNGSWSSVLKLQYRFSPGMDYNSATAQARRRPIITALNFKDGIKMTDKANLGTKIDYQPFGPELRLSLTTSYTAFADKISNRNLAFAVNAAQNDPSSTLTRVVATPSANTRLNHSGGHGKKQIDTSFLATGFVFRKGSYVVDGQVSYSRARLQNGSDHLGAVDRADMNIQQVGWTADRPSVDSTEWTIVQTAGRDWYNLNNYTLSNVVTGRTRTKTQQFNEQINFRYVMPWSQPTFFKSGLYHQVLTRAGDRKAQATYGWVGPNGSAAASPAPVSIADFRIGQAFGGNVQSLPVPDKTELYRLIFTQPAYFTQTEAQRATDLDAILGGNQSVQEAVTAAYLMGNTRVGRLHLQAGLRYEGTETESQSSRRISDANNPYPANTVARILHRWSGGRDFRTGSYHDYLPSAAATYRFSPAMQVKLGYHKAVRRPDLSQLAATWDIDDANQEIDLPNPNLKPERSEKYSALVEYYFEPAGTAGIHFFQSTLTNNAQRTDYLPASEFGYENDPLYSGYLFRGWENAPTTRRFRGVELNYTQQLAFFRNEFLRGMRVFAAYSMYNARPRPNNYVSRHGSAGVSFRYRGFSGKFNGTWRPDVWTGANTVPTANNTYFFPGDREAQKERVIIDIDGAYQITRRFAVFASVRNAFNAPIQWYYPESDRRIRQQEKFGAQWTVGVRGSF